MGLFDAATRAVEDSVQQAKDIATAARTGGKYLTESAYNEATVNADKIASQLEADQNLAEQKFGYDTALEGTKFQNSSALSSQAAQQELEKQIQQQQYELEKESTTNQRKVADMLAAGLNPALQSGISENASAKSAAAGINSDNQLNGSSANSKHNNQKIKQHLQTALKTSIFNNAVKNIEELGGKLTNINKLDNGIFMMDNRKHGFYKDKNYKKTGEVHWRKQAYSITGKLNRYIKTINNIIK